MTEHIKYNGVRVTRKQLERIAQCTGVHQSLTELFECTSCKELFEYQ